MQPVTIASAAPKENSDNADNFILNGQWITSKLVTQRKLHCHKDTKTDTELILLNLAFSSFPKGNRKSQINTKGGQKPFLIREKTSWSNSETWSLWFVTQRDVTKQKIQFEDLVPCQGRSKISHRSDIM
ncbi:hypothetical protein WICPIJ_007092 [Wickerhamomyces pijperi]|uniref:Uncharacterized protein n=1 Tax=Wickerhamomyces pijperi TaxID=599730 RepID=A0A9P8Q2F2_WICPI|nr:hypothetical protein WICPIJ_007092 [Wickerhamomyces pijperi]